MNLTDLIAFSPMALFVSSHNHDENIDVREGPSSENLFKRPARCLFLVEDYPITPNASGGGPSVFYSHLELLAYGGFEITLVLLTFPSSTRGFRAFTKEQPEIWERVRSWCVSIREIPISVQSRPRAPLRHIWMALRDPAQYLRPELHESNLEALRDILREFKPHILWAEHLLPASLALRSAMGVSVVYSHHDWESRIGHHRRGAFSGSWRGRFQTWMSKRMDHELVRRASACVCVSYTEAEEVRALGVEHVLYLPTTYEPGNLETHAEAPARARLVHLGGMRTTANRLGLQRFLDVSWPRLSAAPGGPPELWVIGNLDGAPPSLREALERIGAVCPGFVENLDSVLRPYDLHLIPWEHNTGTRTRLPLALKHRQVVVATRETAACLPELRDGHDCLLVSDLSEMADVILALIDNADRRKRLGDTGRTTFLEHYTRPSVQETLNRFLSALV
jgi:glycosyltransferase involved in cell wall biosynthesis